MILENALLFFAYKITALIHSLQLHHKIYFISARFRLCFYHFKYTFRIKLHATIPEIATQNRRDI